MAWDIEIVKRRLLIGAGLLIIVPALIAGTIYNGMLRAQITEIHFEKLEERGNWAGDQINLRLDQLWGQISVLSKQVDLGKLPEFREKFTLMTQIDNRFSWIGVADTSGKVLISSNGMLENESVAERPWFRSGLKGPFAGDVHEAVLLQNLLPKRDEPYRFIDFSAPIHDEKGEVVGVLGGHFDWVWIIRLVDSLRSAHEETILLAANRRILHAPSALNGQQLDVHAAKPGAHDEPRLQLWPDGHVFLTRIVPLQAKAGSPSFGWSLALRSDGANVLHESSIALWTFWTLLGAALLVSLAGTLALIHDCTGERPLFGASRNAYPKQ